MVVAPMANSVPLGKYKVTSGNTKTASHKPSFSVVSEDPGISKRYFNIYNTASYNTWMLADRESQIKHAKQKIKDLQAKVKEAQMELEFLEKYENEEDFVAHKLEEILTAHAASDDKSKRVNSIKDVLSTLKKSNLL